MGITSYEGGYESYLEQKISLQTSTTTRKKEKSSTEDAGEQYRQKRNQEAERRKKQNRFARLEEEIGKIGRKTWKLKKSD